MESCFSKRSVVSVALLNSSGKLLQRQKMMVEPGIFRHPVMLRELPKGFYVLHITNGNQVQGLKLVY
jgi:hypothetical protein